MLTYNSIDIEYWIHYPDDTDLLTKLIIGYLSNSINFFIEIDRHVRGNRFITADLIRQTESLVYKGMRNRYLVKKYIRKYIFSKKSLVFRNTTSLLLDELDDTKQYAMIITNKDIYRFTPSDVSNLIISRVESGDFQLPEILNIVNPYTRAELTQTDLYNLYISSYNIKMPWIFREFALTGFDKKILMIKHRSYLLERAVLRDIKQMTERDFRKECDYLFKMNLAYKFPNTHYKYNGLSSLPIYVLRNYFTSLIVSSHLDDYSGPHVTPSQRTRLFKLWSLYPHIITKIEDKYRYIWLGDKRLAIPKKFNRRSVDELDSTVLYNNSAQRARLAVSFTQLLNNSSAGPTENFLFNYLNN
tara:strand:- start:1634 stop:2707 length:1074 start_codon:yes stop_codon:yes gene_type:complete